MADYRAIARQAAAAAGIDPDIFERQIAAESSFDPTAQSPVGAQGIAQIMPDTARDWGVDASDPVASLYAAASHMAGYLKQYGDYSQALAAYNWGPGNLQNYGLASAPAETRNYISTILGGGGPTMSTNQDQDPSNPYSNPNPKPKGGLPDVSTHTLNDPPGTVYQGPGGMTFYFDGFALKPLSTSSTTDKYINLGNGNLFDSTTGEVVNTGTGSGGSGSGAATASISANASIQNEQTRAQNAMDIAKLQADVQNARNANDKQAATDALNAKYAEMSGKMPDGSPTLAAQGQQFNQFKTLSDIASNPRNYMQTFFLHRGQTPPADSGGYGNGPSGLGSQYATPSFMGGQGAGGPSASAAAAPAPKPYIGHGQAVDLPNSTTSNTAVVRPPWAQNLPTDQSGALTKPVGFGNGMMPTGAHLGQGDNGVPISLSDWAVKNLTGPAPAGANVLPGTGGPGNFPPNTTTPMAQGGVTPEPIMGVGMHSNPQMFQAMQQSPGHKYLIGEKGPEGVVPAHLLPKFLQSRQGRQALPGGASAMADGGMIGAPQGAAGGDMTAMFGMGGPLGLPTRPMQAAMRQPLMGSTMDGGAAGMGSDITAFADGGMLGGSPTTADTAMIGGVKTWAGGPYSGMAVDKSPANAGDLTPYLKDPSLADPTGRVPQPQPYSIGAPSAGERGGMGTVSAGVASTGYNNSPQSTGPGGGHGIFTTGANTPQGSGTFGTAPAPTSYSTGTPLSGAQPSITAGAGVTTSGYGTGIGGVPIDHAPGRLPDVPQGSGTFGTAPAPTNMMTGINYMNPAEAGGAPGAGERLLGAANTPQMAAGNPYEHTHTYSGNVSPYDQLSQAGAIPPWLSRVTGQAQGDQSVGTNTPQMAYQPPGVPLVSQLAYDQMDPSEQQALLSYVSSYGVDPADYIAQVHGQMSAARRRQSIHYVGQ